MMPIRHFAVLALAAGVFWPSVAASQMLTRPERAAERVAPRDTTGRTQQSLTLTVDALGGYDDNQQTGYVSDPDAPPVIVEPTNTAVFEAGLQYRRARGARSFGLTGRGAVNAYGGGAADIGPTTRAEFGVEGTAPMGRNNTFSISERVTYDQMYSVAAFNPIAGDVPTGELPIDSGSTGITDLATYGLDTSVNFDRRISRRDTLTASYGYVQQFYTSDDRDGNHNHRANATYSRTVTRFTSLNASYGYSTGNYTPQLGATGAQRSLSGHSIEGGFSYTKRISPRRALQLSAGGGAGYTEAITGGLVDPDTDAPLRPYSFWAPSGNVSARIDIVRSWALSGNYRHGTSALEGLTGEAYSSSAFGLSVGGQLPGRLELMFTGGYARGAAGAGSGVNSDYTTSTGAVQLNIPISRQLSGVVQYNYYQYEFTGDVSLPTGFPPGYDRSSFRAGISWRLPVITSR